MKDSRDYYIGLDIGTDSIGWAVTDTNYELLKFKGNVAWGIRLLEESNTADERRAFRTARRRTQRSKFRLQCLEMLFNEEISKVDIAFFQRLHDSSFLTDDKTVAGKYSLFNDAGYTDADYHKQYPTIYHLRKALLDSNRPHDVRLVYLALAHIIKHRGHFLFDSDTLGADGMPVFADVWTELCAYLQEETDVQFNCVGMEELQDILKSKKISITKKKDVLAKLFSITKKDEPQYSVLSLLAGATVNTAVLFGDDELKNSEVPKLVFNNGFDEKAADYEVALGERFALIERLKAVYDWAVLADVLQEKNFLSYAKCDIYDKHASDLQLLKAYVKAYAPNKYKEIFNTNKKGLNNYVAYSGHDAKNSVESHCMQADFLDYLKKQLPSEPADEKYRGMYEDMQNGVLLPKAVTKDNSVIPMQIQFAELKKILQNASCYLPFLTAEDATGKTVAEKITDVFTYRIPYYVGPLNPHSDKAWLVRKEGKIYPWNFTEIVDVDRSAEKFIENLTSKCTYLPREDVLPKNSILYSVFAVLNELNNLKLDGQPVKVELKQQIYNDLFVFRSKVTQKALKAYLKKHGFGDVEITGIDGDFKNTLKSLQDLAEYDLTVSEKEEIIRAITIFGDDKKLLKKRIVALFGSKLTDEQIKRICKLKYSGWGRLSRKFLLDLPAVCDATGEVDTIIGFMWSTNCNLMQLLSQNYKFNEAIQAENGDTGFTSLRKEVENLYVSPKVKRPIYQTMQIVEELVKIFGHEPKKIFVEVARGEGEKKRTVSRKDKLLEIYKGCKKGNEELFAVLDKYNNNEFRRDALYLYFTQMGRCMYTGEVIPVDAIFDRNLYDIDHIFPQSKIKDDSLDNRVLVKKTVNEEKTNIYPIASSIRNDRKDFWKMLLDKGLISKTKFDRLTRNTPLSDEELSAFISRQLVETRQSTKAIAQLLGKRYAASDIVYVKAGLVSEFRQKYKFVKCRAVNDHHHAKDAYLNIVVGNVHNTRFTRNAAVFINGLQSGKYSLNAMYDRNVDGAWIADGEQKSIDTVRKVMAKNNIRFTRYSYKQKGGLFDQQLLKKGNGQVSIKKNSPLANIDNYGGYNRATSTFFALAQFADKKGEPTKAIVPVDLYRENEYWQNPSAYVCDFLEVDEAQVLIPCIKYNTLISINGFRMHISSKSGGGAQYVCKPAMQLVLAEKYEIYCKHVTNYLDKCAELRTVKEITPWDHLSTEENIALYDALTDKLNNSIFNVKFGKLAGTLPAKREKFVGLTVYEQCTVLVQILNILHCNVLTGDLTPIDEAKKSGATTISSKVAKSSSMQSFKIIHQSVTGLFEQEIELL